jgi:hypothetical protein
LTGGGDITVLFSNRSFFMVAAAGVSSLALWSCGPESEPVPPADTAEDVRAEASENHQKNDQPSYDRNQRDTVIQHQADDKGPTFSRAQNRLADSADDKNPAEK